MNFFNKSRYRPRAGMVKILLVMKLIILLLTTAILQVSASSFAQKLTYTQKGATLEQLFTEIKKQTGYFVVYAEDKVDKHARLDVNFKSADLKDVLEVIAKSQNLTYSFNENNIGLKPKEPSFLEGLAERWASIDISGRVVDAEGKALPGATVKVKATGKGVSTDGKGGFHLKGVEEGAVLVVSYTGYISKDVKAEKDMGNVVLEQSLSKLDEVQVIAYGTTTQRLSTGNVTTIKADVIEKQPVNNPLLALQGRVPGLFIEQATGFAGTGVKVRIQGQNSRNNGNDPFYVIDGIPYSSQLLPGGNPILGQSGGIDGTTYGNPLNFINPADIESIDILKDADATAIYGSRAANGAILITTKKGKAGDTRINFNLQSGWAKVPRKLDLMNSLEYLQMREEALKNDGILTPDLSNYGDNDLNGNWDTKHIMDWQKELIGGTAKYNDLQASVSGGNNATTFLIGGTYHKESNVFPGNFSDIKASVHFSINNTSTNQRFKIQLSGSYLDDNNQLPNLDLTSAAMQLAPIAPYLYNSDGNINWAPDRLGASTFFVNPIGYMYNNYQTKTSNLISNAMLSYQIFKGLDIKSSFGYSNLLVNNVFENRLQSFSPEDINSGAFKRNTRFGNGSINSWSIEPQLTFIKKFGKGKLEALVGTTIQENNSNGSAVSGSGFSNDIVMKDIKSATALRVISSLNSVYKYNALFARINYNWLDKYILNLTGRRDGSSRFGPENQFHDFAAIGGAWIFTEENFSKDQLSFLTFGKLRASYGTTGNDQISDYQFLSLYSPVRQDVPYQGVVAYQPNGLTNPYLQWESTKKIQLGLDLGFLKERILINANYYINRSSNLLNGYGLPATAGFYTIIRNQSYKIKNSGWELALSTTNLKSKNFIWSSSINLTIPKTLLMSYPKGDPLANYYDMVIGKPLNVLNVYHYLGVDPGTGQYQFADVNGNSTISPQDPKDKTVFINPFPEFYGGFQNTISYKGLQLDILFSFVKQIAQNYSFGSSSFSQAGQFNYGMGNQLASLNNRWQKPGDISSIQRFTTGFDLYSSYVNVMQSDAAWADASYIRLKNISLSWQLPENWTKTIRLKSSSFFVQGQNLLTITGYTGLDPESKSSSSLPPLRVLSCGVKVIL